MGSELTDLVPVILLAGGVGVTMIVVGLLRAAVGMKAPTYLTWGGLMLFAVAWALLALWIFSLPR